MHTSLKLVALAAAAALSTVASAQTAAEKAATTPAQAASAAMTPGNQNAIGGSGTTEQRLRQPSDQPNRVEPGTVRSDSSTSSSTSTTTTTDQTTRPARADRG